MQMSQLLLPPSSYTQHPNHILLNSHPILLCKMYITKLSPKRIKCGTEFQISANNKQLKEEKTQKLGEIRILKWLKRTKIRSKRCMDRLNNDNTKQNREKEEEKPREFSNLASKEE
ncbi:hypothetical protein AAHE18_17G153000 [Arachis hypogaea]